MRTRNQSGGMPGKLLLLADHEALIQNMFRPHLEREGFQMVAASNGPTAVELAEGLLPDLIILDVEMPQMDGLQVLRLLKAMELTSQIPVIIISALHDYRVQKEAKACGAASFLTKPFGRAQLLAEIKRVLARDGIPDA